ncbi:AraC family transcriptional regulator [Aquimarina sp. ERC-38]|uniref:AraC family transcriptional regulator n=1 Tax=Aquimarina sp. ERC-38 TaxID=2949996 RepID=UPI0022451374|nr:AraC family transcriptional regulator [Aquimarina sp. ERC-38]UZO81986.1 AraC family transcriptional regulator [Aquimarina sp. ERC-38]
MEIIAKNIDKRNSEEIVLETGFIVLLNTNMLTVPQQITRAIGSRFIQFHFCTEGSVQFAFNQGTYHLPLRTSRTLLLYNPQQGLPMDVTLEKESTLVSVLISIEKFHSLFSRESGYISFLNEENAGKKYYDDIEISPAISLILNQIIGFNLNTSVKTLYIKGKIYELLSLYFSKSEDTDLERCPFLVDEENIQKIKKAKDIIISRMAEPPTLKELSNEIGLPLNKLKDGFKQIYGDPVYTFLFDYKMEVARQLLETGKLNVNEVGLKVGYSTASHFIVAFKKKFGTTPKKYVSHTL